MALELNQQKHVLVVELRPKSQETGNQSGKNIYGYVAKYGPVLQIGEDEDTGKRFVNLDKKFNYETINEIEANSLTQFPKNLGKYEENDIIIKKGSISFRGYRGN